MRKKLCIIFMLIVLFFLTGGTGSGLGSFGCSTVPLLATGGVLIIAFFACILASSSEISLSIRTFSASASILIF